MRNKVIHEYFGVDFNVAWKTIKKSLPALKIKIVDAIKHESMEHKKKAQKKTK